MKKIILLFAILPLLAIGQRKNAVSTYLNISEPSACGISIEFKSFGKEADSQSTIFKIAVTGMTYSDGFNDVTGNGFLIALGTRYYLGKHKNEKRGWFAENSSEYSSTKFEKINFFGANFEGTYAYWSLFNTTAGYKAIIAKRISVEPFIGYKWKWEVKGKGDVDNVNVDNFVIQGGLKVGFTFD